MYQETEQVQTRRRQTDTAIQLARENRWEEAVAVNRAILSVFPNDIDSHNRLGKALMELGRYNEAKRAYKKALELDLTNQIAKKNLERLNVLAKTGAPQAETALVDPMLFIEEMGKTVVTEIMQPAKDVLSTLNAGERVELRPKGKALAVETPSGDNIGMVDPKLAHRLLKLLQGGNEYAAAITSLGRDNCRIIIKETYQHPNQAGRPSFPATVTTEGLRPYTKGSLIRYGEDERAEEESSDELGGDEGESWENETVAQEGHIRLNDAAAAEDVDDDMEE
jgi:hypothetical protein